MNNNTYQRPLPNSMLQKPIASPPLPATMSKQRHGGIRHKSKNGVWWFLLAILVFCLSSVIALGLGAILIYSSGILPGVSVNNIPVGGMSEDEAITYLQANWHTLTLAAGEQQWSIPSSTLGITLDAPATIREAHAQGRSNRNFIQAIFGSVDVPPVFVVAPEIAESELSRIAEIVNIPPVNASIIFTNGDVQAIPAQNGLALDIPATLAGLQQGGIENRILELSMKEVPAIITDATPLLAEARQLLNHTFTIRIYDAVTGNDAIWTIPPERWGEWLIAESNEQSPIGLAFSINNEAVNQYLLTQADNVFDDSRSVDTNHIHNLMQNALDTGINFDLFTEIVHLERQHIVQAGESITSIAWDYGIPYLYIQEANRGIQGVNVGQTITIPPADLFLLEPVIPDKRIVVSLSQQRTWVYENGNLVWDWASSSGIKSSPTWPGIYQVISHEPTAYAGNWDLYMPNFMGIYQPIPGANFTNGFHGFPTRGGGQLLWENSLGTPVTYGCILLSDSNVQKLYSWAENGVVVEIQS